MVVQSELEAYRNVKIQEINFNSKLLIKFKKKRIPDLNL